MDEKVKQETPAEEEKSELDDVVSKLVSQGVDTATITKVFNALVDAGKLTSEDVACVGKHEDEKAQASKLFGLDLK